MVVLEDVEVDSDELTSEVVSRAADDVELVEVPKELDDVVGASDEL